MNNEEQYRLALESLTPGGSEFHKNPQACVSFIKERLESGDNAKRECIKLRNIVRVVLDNYKMAASAYKILGEIYNREL